MKLCKAPGDGRTPVVADLQLALHNSTIGLNSMSRMMNEQRYAANTQHQAAHSRWRICGEPLQKLVMPHKQASC